MEYTRTMSLMIVNKETSLAAIGQRIADTRKALELRPVDVCRDLDIRANAYSQWESGTRRPNLDDMFRFARLYHVTLDWIYLGNPSGMTHHIAQKILGKQLHHLEESKNDEKSEQKITKAR